MQTSRNIEVKKPRKECLITVGATAPFVELIQSALAPESLEYFAAHGYTHLVFQCGDSLEAFHKLKPTDGKGLDITAFDFNPKGLHDEIKACKARKGISEQGLVISHAGAGTILDVMRMGVPLIVVPNSTLLDNHQEELADELVRQGYVTKGDCKELPNAIQRAHEHAESAKPWGAESQDGGLARVVDNIVGYEDDVCARLD